MLPKPFPSQIRIGTDICHIRRFDALLSKFDHDGVRKWASKIFNRLEWPVFQSKCQEWERQREDDPKLFVQWLAGRWAAKEAAIKAHSHRELLRTEISILPGLSSSGRSSKPRLLIDPPARFVVMKDTIAAERGLRPSSALTRKEIKAIPEIASLIPGYADGASIATSIDNKLIYRRRRLILDEERQEADLSISHDGEYAIAVCLALDEEVDSVGHEYKLSVDDGNGEPIHEPEYRDTGFEQGVTCWDYADRGLGTLR